MRFLLRPIFVLGATLLFTALLVSYVNGTITPGSTNFIKTHAQSNNYKNSECVECHNTLTENSRDTEGGNLIGAHRRHFLSVFLLFVNNYSLDQTLVDANDPRLYGCAHCHERTVFTGMGTRNAWTGGTGAGIGFGQSLENDLSYDSSNGTDTPPAGRQVDAEVCRFCHGQLADTPTHIAAGVTSSTYCGGEGGSTCHWSSSVWSPQVQHDTSIIGKTGLWIDKRYTNSMTFCRLCHGGPYVWFQQAQGIGITCAAGQCHPTTTSTQVTGSHKTHYSGSKGPQLAAGLNTCDRCHGVGATIGDHAGHRNGTLNFKDGLNLASTTACNDCHSPSGGYNGVNSSGDSIGSKNNWLTGVYLTTTTVQAGKEKWCVGCHDDVPSQINSPATSDTTRTAYTVGGNNSTYGYYKSGHGLSSASQYDADSVGDGIGNTGAQKECLICHDTSLQHLNTLNDTDTVGQRLLASVNSTATPTVFSNCKACHQNTGGPDSAVKQVSSHGNDTSGGYLPIEQPFTVECQTCHEIHGNSLNTTGNRNLKMIKNNIRTFNIDFMNTSQTATNIYTFDDIDVVSTDDVCVTCHINPIDNAGFPIANHSGGIHGGEDRRGRKCTVSGCHVHDFNEDGNVVPNDAFGASCNGCHTYPPGGTQGTYQGSQTHTRHVVTYEFGCSKCHIFSAATHNQSGVTSAADWMDGIGNDFNPVNVNMQFDSTNPSGSSTVTITLGDRNIQCLNLYCHGQETSATLSVAVWVDGTTRSVGFSELGGTNLASTIPTWDYPYNVFAANKYGGTYLSGACGSCHETEKDNTALGSLYPNWQTAPGPGVSTSTNDWSSASNWNTATVPPKVWDLTSLTSLGSSITSPINPPNIAHRYHLDEIQGPMVVCNACHEAPPTVNGGNTATPSKHVNRQINFKDGATGIGTNSSNGTTVCANCHSVGGAYNGVNLAKQYFRTGVYNQTTATTPYETELIKSTEAWCVGCHDNSPPTIRGATAPKVGGDNSTYGFFKTGHGRNDLVHCHDCHDTKETPHTDQDQRTYAFTVPGQSPLIYKQAYRLKSFNGGFPLVVPKNTGIDPVKDYKMCITCHYYNNIEGAVASQTTNFRADGPLRIYGDDLTTADRNNHEQMTVAMAASTYWNSDWDDATDDGTPGQFGFDSNLQCPTCHNVHGSTYPAMIRDGLLTNKTSATIGFDGLEYSFTKRLTPTSSTATVANNRSESFGGVIRFAGGKSVMGICSTNPAGCHDPAFGIATWSDFLFTGAPLLFPPVFTGPPSNVIDYYRNPIPIPLSAVFTGDTTLTVAFSEPVQADVPDYTNLVASVSGALTITPGSATSSGNTVTFNFTPAIGIDETGTIDILNSLNDSFDFTAMTTSIFGQPVWDGQNQ